MFKSTFRFIFNAISNLDKHQICLIFILGIIYIITIFTKPSLLIAEIIGTFFGLSIGLLKRHLNKLG